MNIILEIVFSVAAVIFFLWAGIFIGREFGSFEKFILAIIERGQKSPHPKSAMVRDAMLTDDEYNSRLFETESAPGTQVDIPIKGGLPESKIFDPEAELWKVNEELAKAGIEPWRYNSMAEAVAELLKLCEDTKK